MKLPELISTFQSFYSVSLKVDLVRTYFNVRIFCLTVTAVLKQ